MSHGNTKNRVIKLFVPIPNVHFVAIDFRLYVALPPIKAGIPTLAVTDRKCKLTTANCTLYSDHFTATINTSQP